MKRDNPMPITRRSLLQFGIATGAAALTMRYSFAAPAASNARFIFIIMRGALDGLSAVPPYVPISFMMICTFKRLQSTVIYPRAEF